MKKFLLLGLVGFTSCSNDEEPLQLSGEKVTVQFNVSTMGLMSFRCPVHQQRKPCRKSNVRFIIIRLMKIYSDIHNALCSIYNEKDAIDISNAKLYPELTALETRIRELLAMSITENLSDIENVTI